MPKIIPAQLNSLFRGRAIDGLLSIPTKSLTIDEIVKYPIVSIARQIGISTISSINISYSAAKDEEMLSTTVRAIDTLVDLFYESIGRAAAVLLDTGWTAFNIYWDKNLLPYRFQQLSPAMSSILVREADGNFAGIKQNINGIDTVIPPENLYFTSIQRKYDRWTGKSVLANVQSTIERLNQTIEYLTRYLSRMSGGHIEIRYPEDRNGKNREAALEIQKHWQPNAIWVIPSIKPPKSSAEMLVDVAPGWEIAYREPTGANIPWDRVIDDLKKDVAMGYYIPPRALLEGEHGTNAEARTHAEHILINYTPIIEDIVRSFEDVINRFAGYFQENIKIKIDYSFEKNNLRFLSELYKQLSVNDANIDLDGLKSQLGVPIQEGGSQEEDSDADI